jgi:putative ABC transport system permease protein
VAATVAGVVALLVSTTSDAAEDEALYRPTLASGASLVSLTSGLGDDDADPAQAQAVVRREVPGATLVPVRGMTPPADPDAYSSTSVVEPGAEDVDGYTPTLTGSTSGAYGADLLVSDGDLPPGMAGLTPADVDAAHAALTGGGVVAIVDTDPGAAPSTQQVVLRTTTSSPDGQQAEPVDLEVQATVLHLADPAAAAVLSPAVADQLEGQAVAEVALAVTGVRVTPEQQDAVTEALDTISVTTTEGFTFPAFTFYTERGYQADRATLVLQLILFGLGGVLMLGGTLTATFLALADARPDLATLAAVGASPRRRRGVAAGYALVVGFVGAVLGALVGFVPGLAIAVPLTTRSGDVQTISATGAAYGDGSATGPYLDVPWLLVVGLVVLLPLLTAAVVAAATRSRLPMTTRIA